MRFNHFTTHTFAGAQALNECGRYLLVDILRMGTDCTNGGVTALDTFGVNAKSFFVPCERGNWKLEDMTEDYRKRAVIFEVLPPAMEGCPYRLKVEGDMNAPMAGGNWAYTSDSRFAETYGAPLSVHDRHE